MRHSSGTGLHPFWYIRLISVFLAVILPLGVVMYLAEYRPDILEAYVTPLVIFGWVIYMIVIIIIGLKIEDVLNKKSKKGNRIISNVELNAEQQQALNQAFAQLGTVFQNTNQGAQPEAAKKIICPLCRNDNVVKMKSGKYVCLTCEHHFYN